VRQWLELRDAEQNHNTRRAERALRDDPQVKTYRGLAGQLERKRKTIAQNRSQAAELEAKIAAGEVDWEMTGNTMKGGAMFLASIWHYLKPRAYPESAPEWRGGKVLIVLDEGILNTDDYAAVRTFIRERFYVKAVISLTRDAFIPISKTSTKTSILFAVKKTDPDAVQREPIFFAHAAKVGLSTIGKVCSNHLQAIAAAYSTFRKAVENSYADKEFKPDRFEMQNPPVGEIRETGLVPINEADRSFFFKTGEETRSLVFHRPPQDAGDRLHYLFFHPKYRLLEDFARSVETVELAVACRERIVRGEQPEYDEFGTVTVLKTVDLRNGVIDYDNALKVSQEFFDAHGAAQVRKGDILIASTGYVSMGKVDIYDRHEPAVVDGHISIVRVKEEYDPLFVVYFLRSYLGQMQFDKWFTGSSGQIELQPGDLGRFLIPSSTPRGIPTKAQERIGRDVSNEIARARELDAKAAAAWREATSRFEAAISRP
jgi:hypothetical protein